MGLTTQDVIDTGFIISLKKGFKIIYDNLRTCEDHLLGMIKKYRDTAMAGRSHTQQGVPITFGYKCANWASEIERDLSVSYTHLDVYKRQPEQSSFLRLIPEEMLVKEAAEHRMPKAKQVSLFE